MTDHNLFADDWINCLRAHYEHVIHERDENNEKSLISVLLQTGFTEEDIDSMRSDAMRGAEWAADQLQEQTEEQIEPEITPLVEEAYQWVIQPEPQMAIADADAYQWVVDDPVESIEEVQPIASVDAAPEVEATSEPDASSGEDEPPADSFVQMSMF